ncbi:MAG: hypothetical protein ACNI28_08990 [Arcobacter sp.]|uniref:hypothetical protein n=1 Tax=Arcobacter sp. TaxID=1872629 RepID=UPI003AFFD251
MIIESSNVKISSQTKSSFEMITQSQVDFTHEVLGFMNINEDTQKFETDGYIKANENEDVKSVKEVPQGENNLSHYSAVGRMILEMILQSFLGGDKKIGMSSMEDIKLKDLACQKDEPEFDPKKMLIKNSISIERSYEYSRSDSIEFNTQATIKTKDNKDINIDLDLSYSRDFYEKHSEKLVFEETHFLDPLVIQYDCEASAFDSLSESMCFNFDINSDGNEKELPLLKDGNGFLVLDKNANGTIDDGSELFGPSTNDGFGELSEYDSDGNNWIDENDSIFKDLRVWTKDESGSESLIALGQTGIGALYLGDVGADMAYNKSAKESMAHLKSNSIFLKEDGTAGIISSFDFRA